MPQYDQDSSYWRLIGEGVDLAGGTLRRFGSEVEVRCFDRFSEDDFKSVYDGLDGGGFDGFFLAPVLSQAASECFGSKPLSAPYAFFDCPVPGTRPVFFIGHDSFQSGMLGGKIIHLLTGDNAEVAVARMLPEGRHINERVAGFLSYCEAHPGLKVREYSLDCRGGMKAVEELCLRVLDESSGRLKGVFVTNANTHMFAFALERLKGPGAVKVVGYDLVSANRFFLENESISFVISQNPQMQAQRGLDMLCRHVVLREEVELEYLVPLDLITKENMP